MQTQLEPSSGFFWVRHDFDDFEDVRLKSRAHLVRIRAYSANFGTYRAFACEIFAAVNSSAYGNEILASGFCAQCLKGNTIKRIDVFVIREFIPGSRDEYE